MMDKKKILITGANGFIGKALTKQLLKSGFDVYALVTKKDEMEELMCNGLHVFELMYEDYSKISVVINCKIDVVIHLAWQGLSGEEARKIDIQLPNLIATNVLLEQCEKMRVKSIIFASTMNLLELIDSEISPNIKSPRSTHIHVSFKLVASNLIKVFCCEHSINYNEAVIAMAYGEGNKSRMIVNTFIASILENRDIQLVSGDNKYDIIYVEDVARAFESIILKGKPNKKYYIGHNWNKTFKEIFTEIKDIVRPSAVIHFGSRSDNNYVNYSLIDREALTKDTGWKPQVEFKESIIRTQNWVEGLIHEK